MRKTDPKREPSSAGDLGSACLLRHGDRVSPVGRNDTRGESDSGHLSSDDREHTHRVEPKYLGKDKARKPIVLRGSRFGDDIIDRPSSSVTSEDSDTHRASSESASEATGPGSTRPETRRNRIQKRRRAELDLPDHERHKSFIDSRAIALAFDQVSPLLTDHPNVAATLEPWNMPPVTVPLIVA